MPLQTRAKRPPSPHKSINQYVVRALEMTLSRKEALFD